ncbi:MAG TPA: hypothetical protein VKY74_26825 [Chloroflexia bacterium]|nr:hypothetical protein [Chloroflexia bacterium]
MSPTRQSLSDADPPPPAGETPEPDPAQILTALRAQIQQRRARLGGAGPDGPTSGPGDYSLSQLRQSVDEVHDLWFVSAHLPITWRVPGGGTALAYLKKATRVLLRWYINPIVEQQNRFNSAVARALVEVTAYQERLAREWQLLDERVGELERVVSRQSSVVSEDERVVSHQSSVVSDDEAGGTGPEAQVPSSPIQNPKSKIQNPAVQNPKSKIQNPPVQNSEGP